MILYKNVDICDLSSIFEKGILSMDECGNNNWDAGKRANNSTSVVYLFSPLTEVNAFPQYGVALLECECDAEKNVMTASDRYNGVYDEYIIDRVNPSEIKRVIIPEIFRQYITVPEGIAVTWCGLKADHYGSAGLTSCPQDVLQNFAKTAPLMCSDTFNFFRGINPNRTVEDLYNVQYTF